MAGMEARSLDQPDETRPFVGHGKADIVKLGGVTVGRGVFEPGWARLRHWNDTAATFTVAGSAPQSAAKAPAATAPPPTPMR